MEHDYANKSVRRVDRFIAYVVHHTWIKLGIFILAFLEAIISPILPEVVVGAVLAYRKDLSWKLLSVISALGSATGASVLYLLGKYLFRANEAFFATFLEGAFVAYAETIASNNTFIGMFIAAFTPLPDRVFAFLSGVFALSFPVVVLAFFLGRLVRVGIVAYFSYQFGDEAREYILKHTKKVTVALVALIFVYVLLKYVGIL